VNDAIDITASQRKTLLSLLGRHLSDAEVWVYGSRANWTSKPQSDLDMVVFTSPDQSRRVADLKEAFEESDLPFRVDLFVWDEIPDSFKRNIEAEHVVLRHARDKSRLFEDAGWAEGCLSDIAIVEMGQSPLGSTCSATPTRTPLLNGPTEFGPHHPTPEQWTTDPRKMARVGDVLFCVRGSTTGRMNWADQDYAIGRGIAAIRHKQGPEYQHFVRGVIESKLPYLLASATGSTFPNVSRTQLRELPCEIPPLPEQKAIAHILGTLDDKIELNRRMNETLEGIARAIFKSWFIDFDPVIDNALRAGNPIPDSMAERAKVRRRLLDQNQPSCFAPSPPAPLPKVEGGRSCFAPSPPAPLPCFAPSPPPLPVGEVPGEGGKRGNYRGGYDFAGLVQKAREMRKKQTPAEDLFWELVRNRRFMDLKFRRQHQFGDYVADFYCHEHRLVIELDGGVHDAQHKKDHKRDAWMKAQGYTVLRFKNEQLLDDPEVVFMRIAASLPLPLGEGRGEGMVESTAFDHLFPDGFEDSVLGEIPKGWKVGKIGDALELAYGKSLAKKTRTSGQFPVYGSGGVSGSHNECLVTGPGIVVGRKGTVGSVYWVDTDFFPIDTVFYVKPRKGYSLRWIYGALQYVDVAHLAADSAVPGVNRNSVYEQKFLLPPIEATAAYEKLTCAFIGYCRSLTLENEKIQSTRDHLLPALLSGRLAVPDLQQKLGRAL
jgi:type I restriction enzyme, S subunit